MGTSKTAVQATQELLALATRRHQLMPQEHRFMIDPIIKDLKDELSLHGDGIGSSINMSDPYFITENPDDSLFLEAVRKIKEEAGELPESLQKIISRLLTE